MIASLRNCFRGTSARAIFAATFSAADLAATPASTSPERGGVAFARSSFREENVYVVPPAWTRYMASLPDFAGSYSNNVLRSAACKRHFVQSAAHLQGRHFTRTSPRNRRRASAVAAAWRDRRRPR